MADAYYTVEEASRFLTCEQSVATALLAQLGRDCSRVCRIRGVEWHIRPTPGRPWPNERAYPVDVIREVFSLNPDVSPFVPGSAS
jgi:hypothetical protein